MQALLLVVVCRGGGCDDVGLGLSCSRDDRGQVVASLSTVFVASPFVVCVSLLSDPLLHVFRLPPFSSSLAQRHQRGERGVQGGDGPPVHVETVPRAGPRQHLVPVRHLHDDRSRHGEQNSSCSAADRSTNSHTKAARRKWSYIVSPAYPLLKLSRLCGWWGAGRKWRFGPEGLQAVCRIGEAGGGRLSPSMYVHHERRSEREIQIHREIETERDRKRERYIVWSYPRETTPPTDHRRRSMRTADPYQRTGTTDGAWCSV